MEYSMIKIGDVQYPKGISFPVVNGVKFLSENFKFNVKELITLYDLASARIKELAETERYGMLYKNDDHFENGGGFVLMAKIRKDEIGHYATWQFNCFTEEHLVTLTIIAEPGKTEQEYIMISF